MNSTKSEKDRVAIRWIVRHGRREIPRIVLVSIAKILLALEGTVVALLSKYAIDAAQQAAGAQTSEDRAYYIQRIVFFGVIILIVIFVRLLLRICSQSLSVRISAGLTVEMRGSLFSSILSKEYNEISKYHSGELMNRLTSDINIITEGIAEIVPNVLYCLTQFAGAFIVLAMFDWRFTMLFLAGGLVLSAVTLFFRKKLKYLHKKVQESDGKVRSFFQEAIESMLVVKTFGVEDRFCKKGDELQKINYDYKMKRRRISIFANAGFGFVFNAGYLFALVWCAMRVASGIMTYGTLTAVLQLISQVQTPFVSITQVIPKYYSVIASAERAMEIENIVEEERTGKDIDPEKFYSNLTEIKFDNITYGYGRDTVIESGSATLKKGEFVAIRGISGIGKSTMMKMLLGVFKPQSGSIRLYTRDGRYIDASPETRPLFSYVPQGNYLFSGTLRENIMLINPYATEEEIDDALKTSAIKDFVDSLPDGLDTVIGEKGLGISEGQAQRLAIARALISKTPVILLDEATSALDADTENLVIKNIKNLKNKTCVLITHKNAALKVCDKEFIIDNKRLYEHAVDREKEKVNG